jgi:hypothetical protein
MLSKSGRFVTATFFTPYTNELAYVGFWSELEAVCCETAGGSEMNRSNKSLSMNVFCLQGIAFIPDNENANIG